MGSQYAFIRGAGSIYGAATPGAAAQTSPAAQQLMLQQLHAVTAGREAAALHQDLLQLPKVKCVKYLILMASNTAFTHTDRLYKCFCGPSDRPGAL